MLITPHYIDQNRQLHSKDEFYGVSGGKWANHAKQLIQMIGTIDILDYGCGKGEMAKALPQFAIRQYDPCIPEHAAEPEPADVVLCTDVLEHIEPDCVDAVLDHLQSLTLKAGLLVINLGPSKKTLPDGRNTHVSQHPSSWWLHKLADRFNVVQLQVAHPVMFCVVRPK